MTKKQNPLELARRLAINYACESRFASSLIALCTPTAATPYILFSAGFGTGNLSEWTKPGRAARMPPRETFKIVTDIVHSGNYAAKVTIHGDDVFNAQQLRAQIGGPRIPVEEGSDTYISFWLYMADP
jgi:hypothetical protein